MGQEIGAPVNYTEKQLQILEVTEKLFSEKGFDGTSVRDIAQVAGVNVAMISYYFGSKEKLLEAMFHSRISSSYLSIESIFNNKELTPIEKVNLMIDNYVDKMMNNLCFNRIILREQITKSAPHISLLIDKTKLANLELVRKIISDGQKKKAFVKNIDVPFLMATMIGTVVQLVNTEQFVRKVYQIEDATEEEFTAFIKKKIKTYLKHSFKAILTYEGK